MNSALIERCLEADGSSVHGLQAWSLVVQSKADDTDSTVSTYMFTVESVGHEGAVQKEMRRRRQH